jgi:hypothetical protein
MKRKPWITLQEKSNQLTVKRSRVITKIKLPFDTSSSPVSRIGGEIEPDKIGSYEKSPSNSTQRNTTLQNRPTLKNIYKALLFLHHVGPISPIYFQVS